MPEKVDRRIKYTKMVLKQSLLSLMRDKPIEKITVKDICEKADINRGTFYAHYSDPYDLLAQIENELLNEIQSTLESSLKAESITGLLDEIFESILQNLELCRILFSDYGDKEFLRRILFIAHDKSIAEWKRLMPEVREEQFELLYTFFSSGCVAIIQNWIQGDMKESPADLIQFIDKISVNILRSFM